MKNPIKILIAAVIALAATASGYSQLAPMPRHPAANIDLSKLPTGLKEMVLHLQANATELRQLAMDLRATFKAMTPAERRAALEKFRTDHASLFAEQRDLAKQIRAQMKALREQRMSTG